MPLYEIEWGLSGGSVCETRIKDVKEFASEAEAMAAAQDEADDLFESNLPTKWWRAKPFKDKSSNDGQPRDDTVSSDGSGAGVHAHRDSAGIGG